MILGIMSCIWLCLRLGYTKWGLLSVILPGNMAILGYHQSGFQPTNHLQNHHLNGFFHHYPQKVDLILGCQHYPILKRTHGGCYPEAAMSFTSWMALSMGRVSTPHESAIHSRGLSSTAQRLSWMGGWSFSFFIFFSNPIGSMYGIYANVWGILMVNVTIYSIHGSYGNDSLEHPAARGSTHFIS